jgi:hypothetical protein
MADLSRYLLHLQLSFAGNDTIVSENTYWLSTLPDVLVWNDTNFFRTACSSYADLTLLQSLPRVNLNVSSIQTSEGLEVTVSNPSNTVAFFIHLRLENKGENVSFLFLSQKIIM